MKLTLRSFSSAIFDISKIDLGWSISGPKDMLSKHSSVLFGMKIRESKYIFEMSKIADERLQSVSFHNHLVARYHIYTSWRISIASVPSIQLFCVAISGLLRAGFA